MSLLLALQGGAGANTLTVSPGIVATVGQSVTLRAARQLAVSPGTAAIVGQSVALHAARQLVISPATVPIAGQSVTLRATRLLVASPATVAITGQSVALRASRQLSVTPATVALVGQDVNLTFTPASGAFLLDVLPAQVAVVGQEVTLTFAGVAQPSVSSGAGSGGKRNRREYEEQYFRLVELAEQLASEREAKKQLELELADKPTPEKPNIGKSYVKPDGMLGLRRISRVRPPIFEKSKAAPKVKPLQIVLPIEEDEEHELIILLALL